MNTLVAMMMVASWTNTKILCMPLEELFSSITQGEYSETVRWTAKETNYNYALFTNQQTGSWSFVGYDATKACLLAAGEKSGDMK